MFCRCSARSKSSAVSASAILASRSAREASSSSCSWSSALSRFSAEKSLVVGLRGSGRSRSSGAPSATIPRTAPGPLLWRRAETAAARLPPLSFRGAPSSGCSSAESARASAQSPFECCSRDRKGSRSSPTAPRLATLGTRLKRSKAPRGRSDFRREDRLSSGSTAHRLLFCAARDEIAEQAAAGSHRGLRRLPRRFCFFVVDLFLDRRGRFTCRRLELLLRLDRRARRNRRRRDGCRADAAAVLALPVSL